MLVWNKKDYEIKGGILRNVVNKSQVKYFDGEYDRIFKGSRNSQTLWF